MEPSYDLNVEAEESPKSVAGAWLFCVLYCAFTFTVFFFAVKSRASIWILIPGFFAATGVIILVYTIRMTINQGKFGTVRFLMERPPPSIGGRLTGSIAIPSAAAGAPTLVAALTCYQDSYKGGNDGGWSSEPMWCGKHSFPIHGNTVSASAAIAIDIPSNLEATKPRPATIEANPDEPPKLFWNWKLQVTADLPGVDLDRTYPIVVLPAQPGAAIPAAVAPTPQLQSAVAVKKQERTDGESQEEDTSAVWVLVAANLVPVAGAVFWGWRVEDIVFLYWMENLVIGAFNIPRILLAEPDQREQAARGVAVSGGDLLLGKLMFAAFFFVHYGMFCFGHGEFLLGLFPGVRHAGGLFASVAAVLHEKGMLLAVLAIVASRGYSFIRNYIGRREYDGADLKDLMFRPYKRIVVTHIFILAGGFLLEMMKLPVAALVLFIAIKIGADAHFHRRERKAFA